jgi:hypothetical protein
MCIPMTDNRLNSSMLRPKKPFARRLGVTLIVSCLCAPDRLQVRQINKDIYDFNDLGASPSLCRSLSPVRNVLQRVTLYAPHELRPFINLNSAKQRRRVMMFRSVLRPLFSSPVLYEVLSNPPLRLRWLAWDLVD